MQYYIGKDIENYINKSTAMTIGNFDGLHLGHKLVIDQVLSSSKELGLDSLVLSFTPHPISVVDDKIGQLYRITSSEEKIFLLEQMGIDKYIEYPFTEEFAGLEPEEFVREFLIKKFKAKVIVLGEGFRFGSKKKGDIELIREIGKEYGVSVFGIKHYKCSHCIDGKVSSSNIRQLISEKDIKGANKLLGRPYFIMGEVLHGKKLGRTIGFPTVNIIPQPYKLVPPNGIYFTKTHIDGVCYNSVTNVGHNPTFENHPFVVETYIFNFDEDVYGKTIRVEFYEYSRGEVKFDNLEQLRNRIELDRVEALDYFRKNN